MLKFPEKHFENQLVRVSNTVFKKNDKITHNISTSSAQNTHLNGYEKEAVMTIRTALKREGLQEGLQQGMQRLEEAAIRLLGTGMQAAEVIQITDHRAA